MPFPADAESGFAFLFPYRKHGGWTEWPAARSKTGAVGGPWSELL